MITNAELIREIRKPGKITLPVLRATDVTHIAAEKADLIAYLRDGEPDGYAPWCVVRTDCHGVRYLDIQS